MYLIWCTGLTGVWKEKKCKIFLFCSVFFISFFVVWSCYKHGIWNRRIIVFFSVPFIYLPTPSNLFWHKNCSCAQFHLFLSKCLFHTFNFCAVKLFCKKTVLALNCFWKYVGFCSAVSLNRNIYLKLKIVVYKDSSNLSEILRKNYYQSPCVCWDSRISLKIFRRRVNSKKNKNTTQSVLFKTID